MGDIIKIIIVDDQESEKSIELPRNLAFKSVVIKNMVADCSTNYVRLRSYTNLIHIKNLLENMENNDWIINYLKTLSTADFLSLLRTINYLDIPLLFNK